MHACSLTATEDSTTVSLLSVAPAHLKNYLNGAWFQAVDVNREKCSKLSLDL